MGDYDPTTCAVLDGAVTCLRFPQVRPAKYPTASNVPGTEGTSAITKVIWTWDVRGHFCGLIGTSVRCWRDAAGATLEPPLALPPVASMSKPSPAGYACAVSNDGAIFCWGKFEGKSWQLNPDQGVQQVSGVADAVSVAVDRFSACYIRNDGTVACWGDVHGLGAIGSSAPVTVDGITDAKQITSYQQSWCALSGDGTTRCWGRGFFPGRKIVSEDTPVPIALEPTVALAQTGTFVTCALGVDKQLRCWGNGNVPAMRPKRCSTRQRTKNWRVCSKQELGVPRKTVVRNPTRVKGFSNVDSISTDGTGLLCAQPASGRVACWNEPAGDQFHTSDLLSYLPQVIRGKRGTIRLQ